MRTGHTPLTNIINQPKEVGLIATFQKMLPVFDYHPLTDSLGLTDPAWIDACNWQAGILRVTSVGNVLYTQYVADINGVWPAWFNTGIALYPNSRPAVDGGYVWYQKSTNQVCYRLYSNWASETAVKGMPGAVAIAPLANRAYALWQRNAGAYEILSMNGQDSSQYTIYGLTSMPRVDAVSFGGKEYFYTMDRDAGRVIEIKHAGNAVAGADNYGVGKSIIPIDAIDDIYGLKLGYASVIDSKVVVTGRLTRTSDDAAVSFDVYAAGPENFAFGREMFIHDGPAMMGKMLRVGNEFIVSGATSYYIAKSTTVFGGSIHPTLEVTTSDLSNITLTEAENRSTNLDIDMSPNFTHPAISVGSDVELELGYNENWVKLTTCSVEMDRIGTEENGQARIVSGVGKSAKRLASWAPDQGVYIPSQATMYDNPARMTRVIRANGKWESTDPENLDAPVKLTDLNKLGVLYSSARASRGGAMRGKFSYPSGVYFKPYYGVAVNYYRETAAEAAARLGVEVDELEDDMFGHNGIAAIYNETEHSGGPGVGLYIWKDSVLTKLTSASLPALYDTWHWLQLEFIEGEIRVKYRLDSSTLWTDCITYMYNSAELPWKRETLGRGAILIKNISPYSNSYGFGASDNMVAVDDHSGFPATGTLLVDQEQISFTSKTPTTLPADGNANEHPIGPENLSTDPDPAYASGTRVMVHEVHPNDDTEGKFIGMAAVFGSYSSATGLRSSSMHTSKIVAWDGIPPRHWEPVPDYYSGWKADIGNLARGHWIVPAADSGYAGVYVDQNPAGAFFVPEMPYVHPYVMHTLSVHRGFNISARGVGGTVPTSHGPGIAHLYTGKYVLCAVAASFSQDDDQTIEDALKMIVGMAGGKAACKATVDETHVFSAAGLVHKTIDHRNFVCELELPAINDGAGVGVAFRASSAISIVSGQPASAAGYHIEVERVGANYYLSLNKLQTSGDVVIEQIRIHPTNTNGAATAHVPAGTLKLSVQDDLFSVWLNGRYLHTFHNTLYPDGLNMAFVSRQAATFRIHLSELDDLLADIVVGTRGNGMSVIGELLGDRHVLWRDEPDGSLFFYKTRSWQGDLPDIVSAVSKTSVDSFISRMRAEGLNISEIYDADLLRQYGNMFVTINARHANNVSEARAEAKLLIDENWRHAFPKRYLMDVHPGLQPGDGVNFTDQPNSGQSPMAVTGQSISVGFSGNGFICEMQCDAIPYERP